MRAAKSGVATTYMPVMKPETLAGVCARPAVCRICATPYRQPRTTACRRDSRVSRPSARGASSTSVTLAIANRTARKSRVGHPLEQVVDQEERRAPARGDREQRRRREQRRTTRRDSRHPRHAMLLR